MTAEIPPELDELIDLAPVHAAEAEIAEAQRRHQAAQDAARAAERDLHEAKQVPPRLLDAALAGTSVSVATLTRAYNKIADATRYVDFTREVARRLEPDQREGEQRLAKARAEAYAGLLNHAIDRRIEAAQRADKAADTPYKRGDPIAYRQAHRDWKDATAVLNIALQRGARHPGSIYRDSWPSNESAERQMWNRPVAGEGIAA